MWVRSQDKKVLGDFIGFSLETTTRNEKKLFIITGVTANPAAFSASGRAILGIYQDQPSALSQIEQIEAALNAKSSYTYQMK